MRTNATDHRGERNWLVLVIFVGLCAGAASFGALFQPGTWYDEIRKPEWTPPDALFPPVWTSLYLMIATSGWLLWSARGQSASLAFWAGQLVLNALWSFLFFGLQRTGFALVEIILLWLAILATMVAAWPVHRLAAALLVPYWLWVTFAGALNAAIWQLNRG